MLHGVPQHVEHQRIHLGLLAGLAVAQEVVELVQRVAVIGAVRPVGDGELFVGIDVQQAERARAGECRAPAAASGTAGRARSRHSASRAGSAAWLAGLAAGGWTAAGRRPPCCTTAGLAGAAVFWMVAEVPRSTSVLERRLRRQKPASPPDSVQNYASLPRLCCIFATSTFYQRPIRNSKRNSCGFPRASRQLHLKCRGRACSVVPALPAARWSPGCRRPAVRARSCRSRSGPPASRPAGRAATSWRAIAGRPSMPM